MTTTHNDAVCLCGHWKWEHGDHEMAPEDPAQDVVFVCYHSAIECAMCECDCEEYESAYGDDND